MNPNVATPHTPPQSLAVESIGALPASSVPQPRIELLDRSSRHTKIVATLGPASSTEEQIRELILSGVNICRLNFSHGTHAEHLSRIEIIRKVSRELGCPVGILQDLCGPKLRIGKLPSDELTIADNSEVRLRSGETSNSPHGSTVVPVPIPNLAEIVQPGHRIFMADGKVALVVTKIEGDEIITTVARGAKIRTRAGIAFPDTDLQLPVFTEKDLIDLEFGLQQGVDFVALSFVKEAQDIVNLRAHMQGCGRIVPIIAKIERKAALEQISEIVKAADGVMVARGDLGVDIPFEKVPAAQRLIISEAHRAGKPVIVATQMLVSMTEAELPTRSEANDVVRAAEDGADALMLSEETAIGKHPAQCVRIMARAAREGELSFDFRAHEERISGGRRYDCSDKEVLAISAAEASVGKGIHAIILHDPVGDMAYLLSKHRPHVPVYAFASDEKILAKMGLCWGVHPYPSLDRDSLEELMRRPALEYFAKNPGEKEFGTLILHPAEGSNGRYTLRVERVDFSQI